MRLQTLFAAALTLAAAYHLVAPPAYAQQYQVGTIKVDLPWTRSTPTGSKVAGGFMRIENTGKEPDRLIGGTATVAGRLEIHEMAMIENVMKMRELALGIEIKPGQSVELKPGSYHVMFMDLQSTLKEGDKVKGTLLFEKAGKIEIEYTVRRHGRPDRQRPSDREARAREHEALMKRFPHPRVGGRRRPRSRSRRHVPDTWREPASASHHRPNRRSLRPDDPRRPKSSPARPSQARRSRCSSGFTFCPDVCPTTMIDLTNVLAKLGPDADRMRYFFISVDTERDTPEHLKLYLSNFDKRIVGLTGTAEEIAAVARAYRAYYEKVPTKDGFTYNHTALVYLMGRDGQLAGTIAYQEAQDTRSRSCVA